MERGKKGDRLLFLEGRRFSLLVDYLYKKSSLSPFLQSTKNRSIQIRSAGRNESGLVVLPDRIMHRRHSVGFLRAYPLLARVPNGKLASYFILDCLVKFAALATVKSIAGSDRNLSTHSVSALFFS